MQERVSVCLKTTAIEEGNLSMPILVFHPHPHGSKHLRLPFSLPLQPGERRPTACRALDGKRREFGESLEPC